MTRQSTGIILALCLITLVSINLFNPPVTLNPSYPRPQSVLTDYVRVAAISDFGQAGRAAAAVATQVAGWEPDFIVTTGDNNYRSGADATAYQNMGQYYHRYIYPYLAAIPSLTLATTPSPSQNRFWPTLGNHDWISLIVQNGVVSGPHLDYFTLNGNERYYDLRQGALHFL